jgi:hypothetical protein
MKALLWVRAVAAGWAALLLLTYLVESPLIYWTAPLIGPVWIATVQLALDCAVLTAAGWFVGWLNRAHPMLTVAVFALTLSFLDLGSLNVPGLLRTVWNTFHDSRYLDSLLTGLETHAILFGCLVAGAALSRRRQKPLSIR